MGETGAVSTQGEIEASLYRGESKGSLLADRRRRGYVMHSCHIRAHSTAFAREVEAVRSSSERAFESKTVWETLL